MIECDALPTVRVIRKGYLSKKGETILRSSSTVSLVESGSHRIVVDTGDYDEREEVTQAFEAAGAPLHSVNMVVNTHLHHDHVGGNELFPNARVFAHVLEEPPVGTVRVSSETALTPGVLIVPTPGHTSGSISVFVQGRRRYAICGDALPTRANYDNHTPPSLNIDSKLALRTVDAILAWADIVVPGHDSLFEVVRRYNKA